METDDEFKQRLQDELGVPITSILRDPNTVIPSLNKVALGEIPLTFYRGEFLFSLTEEVLKNLNWGHVYYSMEENILHSIKEAFEDVYEDVKIGTWRHLYLRKNSFSKEFIYVSCWFNGKEWEITQVAEG